MKLFLIRHGETEHNVAGLLAGVTDSVLTNHGVLQTQRLGRYLAEQGLRFTHFYASDLQRAYMTANAIADAQQSRWGNAVPEVVKLEILREQDFGSFECTSWASKRESGPFDSTTPNIDDPAFVSKETNEAMVRRADIVWDDYVVPLLATDLEEENSVAIVAHGIILGVLWRTLLTRFGPQSIALRPEIGTIAAGRPLQYLPAWTNTGILELEILPREGVHRPTNEAVAAQCHVSSDETRQQVNLLREWKMMVRAVNGKEHLKTLKRTRGGVGSATFDAKQKNLDGFFKKPKLSISGQG